MSSTDTISQLDVSAYKVPTDFPESDGTFEWDSTTLVVVEVQAANDRGLGYTYADTAAADLIQAKLKNAVLGNDPMDIPAIWSRMVGSVRNLGLPGIAASAIAAVDLSLWDLKARILGLPAVKLLGEVRAEVPIYGSGGFTSYSIEQLCAQLSGWVSQGISMVKMKVGRVPAADIARVAAARQAIGNAAQLFVDANGAYSRKQALEMAQAFQEQGVTWFEEPVVASDLEGLRLMRDQCPPAMEIAAGEYGYTLDDFERFLHAGAVDVLQADITRCCGMTGLLQVGALCSAFHLPLSAHTAPSIHLHAGCAIPSIRHLEYFHDHARIEQMLFEGASVPNKGMLQPDLSSPGWGLKLKKQEAEQFKIR